MPKFQITAPDGTKYEVTGPDGSTEHDALAQVMAQHDNAGPQPSMLQTLAASPVGRLAHDTVGATIEGVAGMLSKIDPTGGAVAPANRAMESSYNDSLAAQRNRPGYAKARANADAQLSQGGGSGLSDQLIKSLAPSMAGVAGFVKGGFNSSNASADAQTAAQDEYAANNPKTSTAAQIAGGFMAGPEGGPAALPAAAAKQVPPTIAQLKEAAKAAYAKVDNSGLTVSNTAMTDLGDSLQDRFSSRIDPTLHPDATAAYNRVSKFATDGKDGASAASFNDLDNLRRVVADATQAVKPADKAIARQILDHVDDFVNRLKPSDLDTTLQDQMRAELMSATSKKGQIANQIKSIEKKSPGALVARGAAGADTRSSYMELHQKLPVAEQARIAARDSFKAESDLLDAGPQSTIDALNNARDLWARSSRAGQIQGIIDKAKVKSSMFGQSGYENALRQGFQKLYLNDRAIARFSPEERAAIKQVATGGSAVSATNLLRHVGKMSPQGAIPLLSEIAMYAAGGPGMLAVPAAGLAGRTGATVLQSMAAKKALNIAALGRSSAPKASAALLQMPKMSPGSPIPYGLLISSLMAKQTQ